MEIAILHRHHHGPSLVVRICSIILLLLLIVIVVIIIIISIVIIVVVNIVEELLLFLEGLALLVELMSEVSIQILLHLVMLLTRTVVVVIGMAASAKNRDIGAAQTPLGITVVVGYIVDALPLGNARIAYAGFVEKVIYPIRQQEIRFGIACGMVQRGQIFVDGEVAHFYTIPGLMKRRESLQTALLNRISDCSPHFEGFDEGFDWKKTRQPVVWIIRTRRSTRLLPWRLESSTSL